MEKKEVPKSEERVSFEEDIDFIKQLIETLKESEVQLEKAYYKKQNEDFTDIKKFMISIQEEIETVLNE